MQVISAHGCSVLGYAESDLLGRNWYDAAVASPERERLRAGFASVMAGTGTFSEEVESRHVNGQFQALMDLHCQLAQG